MYVDDVILCLRSDCPDYDGGSQVTEYAVLTTNPDQTSREVYRGHDTECVVAGLFPGRSYVFQVKAFNKAGVMTVNIRYLGFSVVCYIFLYNCCCIFPMLVPSVLTVVCIADLLQSL